MNYCCSIGCHLLDYNRMHQIPVDTIIVYIKTNTIAIITLKSLHFLLCFGRGSVFFFFFAGKIIMVLLLLQNY